MTCRGFIDSLGSYLMDELSAEQRATFEGHLTECSNCAVYLKSYTDTVALAKDALGQREDLDEQMPEDLVRAILAARAKTRIR